jgi:prepilin-type N-terminal cleavage/methylation domain-containing protein
MKSNRFSFTLFNRLFGKPEQGFTLTEVLIVIIIAGVLAGIAAPSWLTFVDRQRLTTLRGELVQTIKEAQAKALRTKSTQSVVIVAATTADPLPKVYIEQGGVRGAAKVLGSESNKKFVMQTIGQTQVLSFGYNGTVQAPSSKLGTLVTENNNKESLLMYRFKPRASSNLAACVVVDTIIGAVREATDEKCN